MGVNCPLGPQPSASANSAIPAELKFFSPTEAGRAIFILHFLLANVKTSVGLANLIDDIAPSPV